PQPLLSTLLPYATLFRSAIFKTYSNVPLKRENKNVYLLSSGVGLATFRPLILDYLNNATNVNQLHSLNIDSESEVDLHSSRCLRERKSTRLNSSHVSISY